jgi:hypothetical protein
MAVTRINNNQITDAQTGNIYVGINAGTKLQNYSITSTKISNNLVYGSDLTVTGNLTVQGNTTTIDTTIVTVEDPLILLASGQTGAPAVDIGYIGQRGTSENIAWVWQESSKSFIAAFTNTGKSNTTITVTSYADIHAANATIGRDLSVTGNTIITGTTSLSGNILGDANITGSFTGGNLYSASTISSTGTITGGNLATGGTASATGTVTGGNVATGGYVSATGDITGGNVYTAGNVSATGNITANYFIGNISGNLTAPGANTDVIFNDTGVANATSGLTFVKGNNTLTVGNIISAVGTAIVGNVKTGGYISATGDIFGSNVIPTANVTYNLGNTTNWWNAVYAKGPIHLGNLQLQENGPNVFGVYLNDGVTLTQINGSIVSATGNVNGGNITTGGVVSATGTVTGGNLVTSGTANVTGTATLGNVNTGGVVSATGTVTGGNLVTSGTVSATGTATLGNVATGGTVSATGNVTGGNLATGGTVSATGTVTGANVTTGGVVSATGTITGGNVATGGTVSATGTATLGNVATGGTVSATGNVTGGNVYTSGQVSADGNIAGQNLKTSGAGGDITGGGNISAGGTISSTGSITGGNLYTSGKASATGNISTSNYFIGNGYFITDVTATNVDAGALTGTTLSANVIYSSLTTVGTLTGLSVSGNTNSGNLNTGGQVSATGNITGANVYTGGVVSAFGNITGANLATGGTVSVAGNITGANVNTPQVYSSGGLTLVANNNNINLSTRTGNVVTNTWINGVLNPTQPEDAANKYYVDNALSAGLDIHTPAVNDSDTNLSANYSNGGTTPTWTTISAGNVIATGSAHGLSVNDVIVFGSSTNGITAGVAYFVLSTPTTTEIRLTAEYNGDIPVALTNGTGLSITSLANAGVGATLTSTTNGPLVLEDYTAALNDRILIVGQTNGYKNGIYYISQVGVAGGGGSPWILTRATDGDKYGQNSAQTLGQGAYFLVTQGDDAGEAYVLKTVGTIVFGTTSIDFAQFSQTPVYVGGNGISILAQTISAKVDNNTTAFDGLGNIIVKAGANLTTPNIGAATGSRLSVTGSITADTSFLSNGTASVTGTITGGNIATGGTVSSTGNITGGNVLTGGLISSTGNLSAGNLTTIGRVSATGNISTSGFYFGNGFYMAGVANADTASKLVNGTSNVNIPLTDGNVTIGVGGTNNIAVFATTGEYVTGLISATGNVTGGNVNTGGTVNATNTITGGNLVTSGTVSATGTATLGNVATGGTVSATGNVTGGNVNTGGTVNATNTITGGNLATGGTVSATGTITGGNVQTSGTISSTGTATLGNVATGGTVSATGTVTGGNLATGGTVSATGTATVGNLTTGGTVSATGNVTGGNVLTGGLISSTGNVTGGNIFTGGLISSTGTITGGNLATGGTASVSGTITGGNVVTGGIVSASGNVTGGNVTTGGNVSATGNLLSSRLASVTGNVTGGNILTAGYMSAQGNVYAANFIGNVSGNITIPGANTDVVFNDSGVANALSGFTFDKTTNTVTVTGTVNGGNIFTGGLISSTGTITGGNLATGGTASVSGTITGGNVVTGGIVSASGNVTGGNVTTGGNVSATGNVEGNILITTGGGIDSSASTLYLNYSTSDVDTGIYDSFGNTVFFVDAGVGTASFGNVTQTVGSLVSFNTQSAITVPVGNTGQRPGTASTGQFRFNTTTNSLEIYDNSAWTSVGVPAFTLITDQQFNGDGNTVVFTLSGNTTTAGAIVSINGVQQIPVTAYAISGTTLTFTEAPDVSDLIDVRVLTTTSSVTSISNLSGNAVVAVSDTSATTTITGDLIVTGNVAITGNVATNQINNGSSAVQIPASNGNVDVKVNGANVTVFTTQGEYVTGNISATGDVIAQNVNSLSDATLKTNVTLIDNAGNVVDALSGVGYDWKDGSGHAYGMIAQAVEEIIPEAVKTDENGIKSINYSMVIPFLVETVKELRQDIAEIKAQLKK